jgi:invasion protein IalB
MSIILGCTVVLRGLAASVLIALWAQPGAAQSINDSTGGASSDGFRPVWQQQQQQPKAKAVPAKTTEQGGRRDKQNAPKQTTATPSSTPMRTVTTSQDLWQLTCEEPVSGKGPRTCSARLRIVEGTTGRVVLLVDIRNGTDGQLRALIQTPTGVQMPAGVELMLGDSVVQKFDYESCTPQNCEALGAVDDALMQKIQAAGEAVFVVRARDGRPVKFSTPLTGIENVIASVRS